MYTWAMAFNFYCAFEKANSLFNTCFFMYTITTPIDSSNLLT